MAAISVQKPFVPSTSLLRHLQSRINDPRTFNLYSKASRQSLQKARKYHTTGWSSSPLCCDRHKNHIQTTRALSIPTGRQSGVTTPTCLYRRPSASEDGASLQKSSLTKARYASTWRSSPWAQRLMGATPRKREPVTLDETLDHGATVLGRSKTANELKLRCTQFDENGNVTLVNGEYKKQDLIQEYKLQPRDLRKIDSSMLPHILVRQSAILVNLLHHRVLIKHDRVLVFDVYGSTDSYSQSIFMYDLEHKLRQKENSRNSSSLPYEFRALEAVLISVTTGLEQEFEQVRVPVVRVLRDLEEDIDREKLRHLLIYSKRLGTFEQRARLVRDALEDLLEEDDDLASMYLTETSQGKEREDDDHTEIEMLLESYHKVCDEIVQASGNLVSSIRNTEEIVKAILDANRNALMLLDLKFSIGTLGIGSGAFIAALYGMNLKNYMEEATFGFMGVTGFSCMFAMVICGYGLTKLRKVQRVSMWGEGGRRNRGSWRDVDSMPALPGETGRQRWQRLQEARKQARKMDQSAVLDGLQEFPALPERRQ